MFISERKADQRSVIRRITGAADYASPIGPAQ
jgi:hypothetical protein